jgi:hypothetical protein
VGTALGGNLRPLGVMQVDYSLRLDSPFSFIRIGCEQNAFFLGCFAVSSTIRAGTGFCHAKYDCSNWVGSFRKNMFWCCFRGAATLTREVVLSCPRSDCCNPRSAKSWNDFSVVRSCAVVLSVPLVSPGRATRSNYFKTTMHKLASRRSILADPYYPRPHRRHHRCRRHTHVVWRNLGILE